MTVELRQLQRLRAHLEGRQPLPSDLGDWLLEQLAQQAGADVLRDQRDAHLRRAGDLVGGSIRRRASVILVEAKALERQWSLHARRAPELGTPRGEVHAARLILPLPAERRLRIVLSCAGGHSELWQVPSVRLNDGATIQGPPPCNHRAPISSFDPAPWRPRRQ